MATNSTNSTNSTAKSLPIKTVGPEFPSSSEAIQFGGGKSGGTGAGVSTTPKSIIPPIAQPIYDNSDLAGRLLNAGVNPNQPSIQQQPALYAQIKGLQPVNAEQVKNLQNQQAVEKNTEILKAEQMNNVITPQVTPQQSLDYIPTTARSKFISEMEAKESLSPIDQFNLAGAKLGAGSFVEERQAVQKNILKFGAQIYDFIYSLTQGGKGIEQKEAESTFADVKGAVTAAISDYKDGYMTYEDVNFLINKAEEANNRLAESTKGWSGKNLRYFLLDGHDVQVQTELNRGYIDSWRNQVVNMRAKGL